MCVYNSIYIYLLEVNHHFEDGGSFWMMINPYQKIVAMDFHASKAASS